MLRFSRCQQQDETTTYSTPPWIPIHVPNTTKDTKFFFLFFAFSSTHSHNSTLLWNSCLKKKQTHYKTNTHTLQTIIEWQWPGIYSQKKMEQWCQTRIISLLDTHSLSYWLQDTRSQWAGKVRNSIANPNCPLMDMCCFGRERAREREMVEVFC